MKTVCEVCICGKGCILTILNINSIDGDVN